MICGSHLTLKSEQDSVLVKVTQHVHTTMNSSSLTTSFPHVAKSLPPGHIDQVNLHTAAAQTKHKNHRGELASFPTATRLT